MAIDNTDVIYLATIDKISDAEGRRVAINIVGKFPLTQQADSFLAKARVAVENAGFRLQFSLFRRN